MSSSSFSTAWIQDNRELRDAVLASYRPTLYILVLTDAAHATEHKVVAGEFLKKHCQSHIDAVRKSTTT